MATEQETWKKWSELVAQVRSDHELKQRLIAKPAVVLQEYGIEVPAGVDVRVLENTDKVLYLTLPPPGDPIELTAGELGNLAGGITAAGYSQPGPVKGPIVKTPEMDKNPEMDQKIYRDRT